MMKRTLTTAALLVAVLVLGWVGVSIAQNSPGGAFITNYSYIVSGQWTWRRVSPWIIEGATDNTFETTVTFTEPTADRTHTHQDATGTVVLAPAATSAGVEGGTVALDGANPTSVTTSLTTLRSCYVTLQRSSVPTPGTTLSEFSIATTASAGRLDIYAWASTSASDPTLVASTSGDVVAWFCVGTR